MTRIYIPLPKTKISKIDVPFSSGSIDLTDITGEPHYEDRTGLEFEFVLYDGNFTKWAAAVQRLATLLHGKKLKMIADNDKSHYYMVRLEVDTEKSKKALSKIVLSGESEPFKYDLQSTNEDWLWNPFSFVDGVIQKTSSITVSGTKTLEIKGTDIGTTPTFIVTQSTNLRVVHKGKTYDMLSPGTYRFPQLKIKGTTTLTFTGTGKLTVSYRGRYL